ncbi:MAG: GtrA family protein [Chloroflexi bacterium]|nr:GtrA family protein [Chloroflexota bacterium]
MTIVLKNPSERARFLKFAAVGMIGALIDFGVMNSLVAIFHTSFVLAGTISFVLAVISNFTWNRFWTYPESRSKPLIGQLGQFALVNAAGLLIRLPILKIGEPALDQFLKNISIASQNHQFISHNATLAIAVGVVMMWNFFVNRHWTYNDIEI